MRNNPIIALIDMDCFYVQVEWHYAPTLKGQPSAVVQYNAWRGGGIIAVSYEARDKGVTRGMRGDEAKVKCPNLHMFSVPETRGKADLTKYRSAGADVIKCLSTHANLVERASVDEAYIDLTDEVDNLLIAAPDNEDAQRFWQRNQQSFEGCHSVGFESYNLWLDHVWKMRENDQYCDDVRIALASYLVKKMRDDVYATLGYRCSAGIAHSKVAAKYACGVHKPNQQTTVSSSHVLTLFNNAPIHKIRNLGGKLGKLVQERLNIETMGQLSRFSLAHLSESFGERTGPWLYSLSRGIDDEGVLARRLAQSMGCSKNFPGGQKLDTLDKVRHWVAQMAEEIVERVEQDRLSNGRVPSHLCVSYRQLRSESSEGSRRSTSGTRVVPLGKMSAPDITASALAVLAGINNAGHRNMHEQAWHPPLLSLGLSAGKFRPQVAKNDIARYLIDAPMHTANKARQNLNEANETVSSESDSNSSPGTFGHSEARSNDPSVFHGSASSCVNESSEDNICNETLIAGSSLGKEQRQETEMGLQPTVKKGFFARRLEREERERHEGLNGGSTESVSLPKRSEKQIGSSDRSEEITSATVQGRAAEREAATANGFFAKRIARERQETEAGREQQNQDSVASSSDYIKCEHCRQEIVVWHAPEHFDWHLAMQLQKEQYREAMDAEAAKRRPVCEAAKRRPVREAPAGSKRRASNSTAKPPTTATRRQRTIDSFFPK